MQIATYQYRIKDSGPTGKRLRKKALAVNVVWNFCKQTQIQALKRKDARIITDKKTNEQIAIPNFLTRYEMNNLVSGASKELGLHSQSIQAVAEEYVRRRKQFGKLLRWRGYKALGWIPFKASGIEVHENYVRYCKTKFSYWNSRPLPKDASIKVGSFSQDARGRWYVSITFESESIGLKPGNQEIGVDLGIKHLATLSNAEKIDPPKVRPKYLAKLKKLEKTRKFARRLQAKTQKSQKLPRSKQVANLHAKVANTRKDYLHKESTKLIQKATLLIVGALCCGFMNRNRKLSATSLDAGIGKFKMMLRYKALSAGVAFLEVLERGSTQTCSCCGWKHPPWKRIGLEVREWICPACGVLHDRDVNAARNILRMGRHALTRAIQEGGTQGILSL